MIAWLALGAMAGEPVDVSIELARESMADPNAVSVERVKADIGVGIGSEDVRFDALGGIRFWTWEEDGVAPRLDRFALRVGGGPVRVYVGRMAFIDPRGVQRLDGFRITGDTGALRVSGWGGRMWRPEPSDVLPAVVGAQVGFVPDRLGQSPWWVGGAVGLEARGNDVGHARAHALVEATSPRGDEIAALAELGVGDLFDPQLDGVRARLGADVPVTKTGTLTAEVRWEDLPVSQVGPLSDQPSAWIAPDGYGVAGLGARFDRVGVDASGVLRPDPNGKLAKGVAGGAAVALVTGTTGVDVFARAMVVGPSWFAGGGVQAHTEVFRVLLNAQAAAWRVHGIDGTSDWVGAAFLSGTRDIVTARTTTLGVQVQAAGGADRLRAPWFRLGLGVQARWRR